MSNPSNELPQLDDGVAPDPYGLISGIHDHHAGTGGHPIKIIEEFSANTRKQKQNIIENDSPLDNGAQILRLRNLQNQT